jgi:undecaprenyl-diphosphatase
MTHFGGLIMGIIQGLTEFLPVSSSGHLVLAGRFLGLGSPDLSFSVAVHLGTALSTLVMLHQEISWLLLGVLAPKSKENRRDAFRVLGLLVLASIPAAFVGILLNDLVEELFGAPVYSAVGLLVTATVLYLVGRQNKSTSEVAENPGDESYFLSVTPRNAFFMGLAQAVAIVPGISRSGSTISAGLVSGVSREDSARFSFLMSLAAISGAALLDLKELLGTGLLNFGPMLLGLFASFLSGLLALSVVLNTVRRGNFSVFAYYCYLVGGISLIALFLYP